MIVFEQNLRILLLLLRELVTRLKRGGGSQGGRECEAIVRKGFPPRLLHWQANGQRWYIPLASPEPSLLRHVRGSCLRVCFRTLNLCSRYLHEIDNNGRKVAETFRQVDHDRGKCSDTEILRFACLPFFFSFFFSSLFLFVWFVFNFFSRGLFLAFTYEAVHVSSLWALSVRPRVCLSVRPCGKEPKFLLSFFGWSGDFFWRLHVVIRMAFYRWRICPLVSVVFIV